jgi:MOSC domain-containing protein YiiM
MSPKVTVVNLQLSPGSRLPMTSVTSAKAIENLGLEGDRHAKAGSKRQVLLIEAETLEKVGLRVGDVRENITTRGIALMELPIGTRLRIGEALFELTVECEPCNLMDQLRPGLKETLKGQRGMLACVVQSGTLSVGDAVFIESPSA